MMGGGLLPNPIRNPATADPTPLIRSILHMELGRNPNFDEKWWHSVRIYGNLWFNRYVSYFGPSPLSETHLD